MPSRFCSFNLFQLFPSLFRERVGGIASQDPELNHYFKFWKTPISFGLKSRKVTHPEARIFLSKKSYCRCATFLKAWWEDKTLTGWVGMWDGSSTGLHHWLPLAGLIEKAIEVCTVHYCEIFADRWHCLHSGKCPLGTWHNKGRWALGFRRHLKEKPYFVFTCY